MTLNADVETSTAPAARPFSFRMRDHVRFALVAMARSEGLTPRSWIEKRVLELADPHIVARPDERPELRPLLFQVGRAGNNLNQVAHRLNSLHMQGRLDRRAVETGLRELERISSLLQEALNRAR